jgi:hypothetical protein
LPRCARRCRSGGPPALNGRLVGRCYMNSSPQWLHVPKPIVAELYCLQDGHRVTCVPQSIHLTVSFDRQALQSRLGIFRGSDSKIDPLRNVPTIDSFSSSIVRAINPVCRSQPGQTAIASRSAFATWPPSHRDPFQNRRNDVAPHLGHVSARNCHDGCWPPGCVCELGGCQPGRARGMSTFPCVMLASCRRAGRVCSYTPRLYP